jgi:hypothetical protein
MKSLAPNFYRNPEMVALYSQVLTDFENALPAPTADTRVRATAASALSALKATERPDPEALRRYAEYKWTRRRMVRIAEVHTLISRDNKSMRFRRPAR